MVRYTHRHFRYLLRLISPGVVLYTEMVHIQAFLRHAHRADMGFHQIENPLILQLGGSCPNDLAKGAALAEELGFHGVNLNVGCPSPKVQAGSFGACLMYEPSLVAESYRAMQEATALPVSIKTRIGVDEHDSEAFLWNFITPSYEAGCREWVLHARSAWLKGLSPKENRTIPPLNYQGVYALKRQFPEAKVWINGGIESANEVTQHLSQVDGVMVGRAILQQPMRLSEWAELFPSLGQGLRDREAIARAYFDYAAQQSAAARGLLFQSIANLYHGTPHAKIFKKRAYDLINQPIVFQTVS